MRRYVVWEANLFPLAEFPDGVLLNVGVHQVACQALGGWVVSPHCGTHTHTHTHQFYKGVQTYIYHRSMYAHTRMHARTHRHTHTQTHKMHTHIHMRTHTQTHTQSHNNVTINLLGWGGGVFYSWTAFFFTFPGESNKSSDDWTVLGCSEVQHDTWLCPYLRLPQRRRSAVPLTTWCPFCSHPVDSNICDCEYHTMGTFTLQPGPGLRSSHLGLGACLCIYKCANLNLTSVSSSYHCCSKHVSCLLYTSRLDSVFQTADDQVLPYSIQQKTWVPHISYNETWATVSPTWELKRAQLTSILNGQE